MTPHGQRPAHQAAGFSLVELLVSMAVMVLLLLALAGITGSTQEAIRLQKGRLGLQQAAGDLFEQIGGDLEGRANVPNAHFYWNKAGGNDELAFYTQRPGYTGDRSASWVHYRMSGDHMERGASGASYGGSTGIRTFKPGDPLNWTSFTQIPAAGYQPLTAQILRIEICALVEDHQGVVTIKAEPPRNPDNTINTMTVPLETTDPGILRGIVATVVALDSRDLALINNGQRTAIAAQFSDAEDGVMPATTWSPIAEDAASLTSAASIPAVVAKDVRVYERIYRIQP